MLECNSIISNVLNTLRMKILSIVIISRVIYFSWFICNYFIKTSFSKGCLMCKLPCGSSLQDLCSHNLMETLPTGTHLHLNGLQWCKYQITPVLNQRLLENKTQNIDWSLYLSVIVPSQEMKYGPKPGAGNISKPDQMWFWPIPLTFPSSWKLPFLRFRCSILFFLHTAISHIGKLILYTDFLDKINHDDSQNNIFFQSFQSIWIISIWFTSESRGAWRVNS